MLFLGMDIKKELKQRLDERESIIITSDMPEDARKGYKLALQNVYLTLDEILDEDEYYVVNVPREKPTEFTYDTLKRRD
jgi:hypothetical protein